MCSAVMICSCDDYILMTLQEMFHGTTCFFYELWADFHREPVSKDQSLIDFLMKDSGLPPNWEPW